MPGRLLSGGCERRAGEADVALAITAAAEGEQGGPRERQAGKAGGADHEGDVDELAGVVEVRKIPERVEVGRVVVAGEGENRAAHEHGAGDAVVAGDGGKGTGRGGIAGRGDGGGGVPGASIGGGGE